MIPCIAKLVLSLYYNGTQRALPINTWSACGLLLSVLSIIRYLVQLWGVGVFKHCMLAQILDDPKKIRPMSYSLWYSYTVAVSPFAWHSFTTSHLVLNEILDWYWCEWIDEIDKLLRSCNLNIWMVINSCLRISASSKLPKAFFIIFTQHHLTPRYQGILCCSIPFKFNHCIARPWLVKRFNIKMLK